MRNDGCKYYFGTLLSEFYGRFFIISRIVSNEKIQVQNPTKSHEPGLKYDGQNTIEYKPV